MSTDLKARLQSLIADDVVAWQGNGATYRNLDEVFPGAQARAVPSLAHKHIVAGMPAIASCPLCEALVDSRLDLTNCLPVYESAAQSLGLIANRMPFFPDHLMILPRQHRQEFNDEEWDALLRLPQLLGVPYLASQQRGSGASLPDHAHVAVSTERLPILDLPTYEVARTASVTLSVLDAYPGMALVLQESHERRSRTLLAILRALADRHLPWNIFTGHAAGVVIVPRTRERDFRHRRAGSPEIGGVLLSNAEGFAGGGVPELVQHMLTQAATAQPADLRCLIEQTTLPRSSSIDDLFSIKAVL